MNKREFLDRLRAALDGLPQADIEECLIFYEEMIEDRIEAGLSEEEAVAAAGTVEEVVAQVKADASAEKSAEGRPAPRRQLKKRDILLIALGSPLWFPLALAALSVVFSLYVAVWAVIVSLWSVFAALIAGALSCLVFGIGTIIGGAVPAGIALVGAALICAAASIFTFFGCLAITKHTVRLTRLCVLWIKRHTAKKEVAR